MEAANCTARDCTVRNDFREAFWRLYSQNGMDGLTAQALCERAGYSRSSFYRHFASVYDLLDELEERALPRAEAQRMLDVIDLVGMADFREMFLRFFEQKGELIAVMARFDRSQRYMNKFTEVIRPLFLAVIERTLDIPRKTAESFADYIVGAKMALFVAWARSASELDIVALLQVTDGVFEAGFWDLVDRSRTAPDGTRPPKITLDEAMRCWVWLNRSESSVALGRGGAAARREGRAAGQEGLRNVGREDSATGQGGRDA